MNVHNMKNIEIINSKKTINYQESVKIMENRVRDIFEGKKNELIWFLNHDHIYTQGTSSSNNEIVNNNFKIPILKTNRGGKTTYHGPGQRIVYLLINLNKRKKDIKKFTSIIESSTIKLLKKYSIEAKSYKSRVGIWVIKSKKFDNKREEKIGAIGLRIKKWVTYHGLSFNINPNLEYYNSIIACGLDGYKSTSLKKLGVNINIKKFDEQFLKIFLKELKKL